MVKRKEIQIDDIYPPIICGVRFVNEEWDPLSELTCSLQREEYVTNDSGYIDNESFRKDDTIKVLFESEIDFDESHFIEDIQTDLSKLMLFSVLMNKSEGGEGPLKTGDDRSEYVTIIQKMLSALGYYLGESGDNNDGVDGVFGDWTRNAVLSFQSLSTDEKTGEPLTIDGLIGPVTIEVLARECVREGILKFFVTRILQDKNRELIWTAHRGTYQNNELKLKDVIELKEYMEKELEESYATVIFRMIDSINIPVTFLENGEPARWLFVYMSPEEEELSLDKSLITDMDGFLRSKGDIELSRILKRGESYYLFYDWRPWSESDLKNLAEGDCQVVNIDEGIKLEPKSGDINVKMQHIDDSPFANRPYLLHLPNGITEEGVTGNDGEISKSGVEPGIIWLEMGTSNVKTASEGKDVYYQQVEPESSASGEGIIGEGVNVDQGDLDLSDEDIDFISELEKELESIEKEGTPEEKITEPDDDTFIVEMGMLREASVILSRGKACIIKVANTWRTLSSGEFRHWSLASSDLLENTEDSLIVLQNPGNRERMTRNVWDEAN